MTNIHLRILNSRINNEILYTSSVRCKVNVLTQIGIDSTANNVKLKKIIISMISPRLKGVD